MSILSDAERWKTKLRSIQEASKKDKSAVMNNITHVIDVGLLKETYRRLDARKAVGIDRVTKEEYGKNLEENLQNLLEKIHGLKYKAKPSRQVMIPKEDGSRRTLSIGCIEDKIVQGAVYLILEAIYEPIFLDCSYGFRPGRNCHDALRALNQQSYRIWDGMVIDMDIEQCFNSIPHQRMWGVLGKKISDRKVKRLISRIMKSPILENGISKATEVGCPQGNILSPMLANIYLHEVLDSWIEELKADHLKYSFGLIRYCDDVVIIFQNRKEAENVFKTLPKRLEKYGLRMHERKSRLLETGRLAAERAARNGERLPTYHFLGFTCYFGKGRNGKYRLMYTSRRDRFTTKLREIRKILRRNLNTKDSEALLKHVVKIVRGWMNYHGISDNERRVSSFREECQNLIYGWFNRRGKKRAMTWEKLRPILDKINYPQTWKTTSMFASPTSKLGKT